MSASGINSFAQAYQSGTQAFISAIIELHDIWTKIWSIHRKSLSKLEGDGKKIEEAFYKYISSLVADCTYILQTLANIKLELEIAKETEIFDQINLIEIKENCDRLLFICKEGHTQNHEIQKRLFHCREQVNDSRKRIVWKILDPETTMVATGCASAIYPGLFISKSSSAGVEIVCDMFSSFAIGSVGGAIFAKMLNYLTTYCIKLGLHDVLQDLSRVESKLRAMQDQSYKFMGMTRDVIRKLTNYADFASKNIKYHGESNTRVKYQAAKMINETSKLQGSFKKIEARAQKYCSVVEKELLETNPQLVLDTM